MSNEYSEVSLKETSIVLPTYKTAKPEKNPMFLENRVYQGSSGKVYPFPVTEKIYDKRVDQKYKLLVLENKYIRVTFLPELGGRIYSALDKTNNYDFVYHNHVIKPALVGLTGSWISGGIEFNWPQHHRPDTFLPVEYQFEENSDDSKTLWMSDTDKMYGTKSLVSFTMFPDRAYLKLKEHFINNTDLPQTFLWWANPAVPVNDYTQSIFPPDVNAVFDHGKRAVSSFPIATGEYYKVDYSAGVDISRYKNIPVPTSYMAAHSEYDFLGNYDHKKQAGLLHVADHHTSPGKKQWTWGNGDFGQSWDNQLTDNDGPYIELMVGTFTDNQPDFTWLQPHEEKVSTEYFMPYKFIGEVKNATSKAALNVNKKDKDLFVKVYATSAFENATVNVYKNDELVLSEETTLNPETVFNGKFSVEGKASDFKVIIMDQGKNILVEYSLRKDKIQPMPEPAKKMETPKDIKTIDELYYAGQHLEQYRHATYKPEDYYLEGLKRDSDDCRINDAYGLLLYRKGLFAESEKYFVKAIRRQEAHNTNPYYGSTHYHLGLSLWAQGQYKKAYDNFYKATWSYETSSVAFIALAQLKSIKNELETANEFIDKALATNFHDMTARTMKMNLLRRLNRKKEAQKVVNESLKIDVLDMGIRYEAYKLEPTKDNKQKLDESLNSKLNNFLVLAEIYIKSGQYQDALKIIEQYPYSNPLKNYYESYLFHRLGDPKKAVEAEQKATRVSPDYVFPNRLFDVKVLKYVIDTFPSDGLANYYLGNLYYDRKVYSRAIGFWEHCTELNPDYPMAHRNLAIGYYNREKNAEKALTQLEAAFKLDSENSRLVFELDTLYEKLNKPLDERLEFLQKNFDLVKQRDDSYISLITLLNENGEHQKAYDLIMNHNFHPWEGGEGKVSTQYEYSLVELAKTDLKSENYSASIEKLKKALVYPRSIGEGKLPIALNNIIDYYLGLSYRKQGNNTEAKEHFEKATLGLDEPTDMMYYNDQPADTIFYQGLAFEQLGQTKKARGRFYKLASFGEHHLFDKFEMDYFAVSLPDALLFDEDYQLRNSVHCYYLMALGELGLGNIERSQEMFKKALLLSNHHQGVLRHKNFSKNLNK